MLLSLVCSLTLVFQIRQLKGRCSKLKYSAIIKNMDAAGSED